MRRRLAALVTVVLVPFLTAPAHAGAPTEQLRGDIARVFQTLDALPARDAPEARRLAVHDSTRRSTATARSSDRASAGTGATAPWTTASCAATTAGSSGTSAWTT